MINIESDWLTVHTPPRDAVDLVNIRDAARRLASLRYGMTMVVPLRLTEWFDWDRLRVNVTHHVSPQLVKWRAV